MADVGSPALNLNKTDWLKIGKGALIALAGLAIVMIPEYLKVVDFGKYAPMMVAGAAVLVNLITKWVVNNQK